jgi:hypothetical protein
MLAVARILRTGARLLLLDEISEGLAPVIVQALAEMIRTLRGGLHHRAGRAELPLRRAAGRPLLRDGARPRRRGVRARPNCRQAWTCCTNTSASEADAQRITNLFETLQPWRQIHMKLKRPRRRPGLRPFAAAAAQAQIKPA